ncbi:MAG: flagellar hook-length control protein FliK [Phycisphaeraceae bacterium]|nr:flagellar hook-length control protein FliK [Phycisphaeraceae bacterium]
MAQVASNLLSVVSTGQTGRAFSRFTSKPAGAGFDQVLENSSSRRQSAQEQLQDQPEKSAVKKSVKSQDDESQEAIDAQKQNTHDPVEDQVPQDDPQDATDMALAAAGVEVAQPVEAQTPAGELRANANQNASATGQAVDAANPLTEGLGQSAKQGALEEEAAKQRHAADAMLRLLGVTTGGGGNQQQAMVTLVDASAGPGANSVSSHAINTQQALPTSSQDDGTMDGTNIARVSRALQNATQQKGGTITIRMMPPELGHVRVDIQMHGGKVSASFQTEHQSVQSLMSRELNQLRQALEKQGFTVDKLEVNQRPASSNASNSSQNESQQQSPSDGRSRGQYSQQSPPQDENSNLETGSLENNFETQLGQQSQTL